MDIIKPPVAGPVIGMTHWPTWGMSINHIPGLMESKVRYGLDGVGTVFQRYWPTGSPTDCEKLWGIPLISGHLSHNLVADEHNDSTEHLLYGNSCSSASGIVMFRASSLT